MPPATARFDRLLLSEWTKLKSLRSTMWTLLTMAVPMVGIGALLAWATVAAADDPESGAPGQDTIVSDAILGGMTLGELAVAVLGALVIGSKYTTGSSGRP